MPISADRVISLIECCDDILEKRTIITRCLTNAQSDMLDLEKALEGSQSDYVKNLIHSIKSSHEVALNSRVDEGLLANLFYEKGRFEINMKKNNREKWRAKMIREGIIEPKKQQNPRKKKMMTMEEMERDYREYEEKMRNEGKDVDGNPLETKDGEI